MSRAWPLLEAEPLTGRTHQIRVHAAQSGIPILGDSLYGGTPADRVYLHAAELTLIHPGSGKEVIFRAPAGEGFAQGPVRGTTPLPCVGLRQALIDSEETTASRLIHGASDGHPGWYVEQLGDYLLSQSERPLTAAQNAELGRLMEACGTKAAYHKILARQVSRATRVEACPQLALGNAAPQQFALRENGLRYELSFTEGYSVGLFLDQRDNRRRLLTEHIASAFPLHPDSISNRQLAILNTFAYTCGFSVCAASAGARVTSVDLSRRYLEWGKRNFVLNQLDPAQHEFLYGDVFGWLRRLEKKKSQFDGVLLDPPTFSQSKEGGVFRAQKDYGRLVAAALPVLKPDGVLFASTNTADWLPEQFLSVIEQAVQDTGRRVLRRHYVPQPPDFPISRAEPAYLKTVWLRVA